MGIATELCVYVGDDERDVIAANRAGMRSIGALWGYRPVDDLPEYWGAHNLAEQPIDLLENGLLNSL